MARRATATARRRRINDRVLTAINRRPSTPRGLAKALGISHADVRTALIDLASAGLITDQVNEHGRWTAMRSKRKSTKPQQPVVRVRRDLEAEHHALIARMYGEEEAAWSAAHRPLAGEADLAQRLDVARLRGMAVPDLRGVPTFRQAAEVERLLNDFEDRTAGGPCDWCGTTMRRHGRGPHSLAGRPHGPVEPPGFATVNSTPPTTGCGWCVSVIRENGADGWRSLVYRAVAGVGTLMDGWDLSAVVPNAIEASDWGALPVAEGLPFSYLTDEHRRAIRLDALANVGRSSWATTPGKAGDVSIPGIASPVHTEATLPPRPPVKRVALSRAGQRMNESAAQAAAKFAADKAKAAAEEARRCAALVERDARFSDAELARQAHWETEHDKRRVAWR